LSLPEDTFACTILLLVFCAATEVSSLIPAMNDTLEWIDCEDLIDVDKMADEVK
jgi:hypothetical protein